MKNFILLSLTLSLSTAAMAQNYDFEAIVKLSNCSGSIIKFNGQPNTAKALLLTNGHCIDYSSPTGLIPPGEVVVNKPAVRSIAIFDSRMTKTIVKTSKLLFATMTDTDMAIYELNTTFQDLENKGISALTLNATRPITSTSIQIISGYHERGYSCQVDGFAYQLREFGYTFTDSIRYSQPGCEIIGGTSGSPVIEEGTRTVVGINNTTNESGERCTLNNPCEVDEQGNVKYAQGLSYGQQTYLTYSCLNVDFQIDLNKLGCMLPKGKSGARRITVSNSGFQNKRL